MARTFEDSLDSFAEAWRPEPGDKLIGTIVELDTIDGDYGSYPVVTVADDQGQEHAFHAFHTVAKNELAKLKPVVGERIGIAYHGEVTRGSNTYKRYKIRVERTGADGAAKAPDWDAMAAETDRELQSAEASVAQAAAPAPVAAAPKPATDEIPF